MKEMSEFIVGKVESETELFIGFAYLVAEVLRHKQGNVFAVEVDEHFLLLLLFALFAFFFFLLFFDKLRFNFNLALALLYFLIEDGVTQSKLPQNGGFLFLACKFQPDGFFLHLLINKQIGTLTFSPPMFSTIAVKLNIMRVKLPHSLVIELNPSVLILLYITEIMPKFSTTIMQYNSLQTKLVLLVVTLTD